MASGASSSSAAAAAAAGASPNKTLCIEEYFCVLPASISTQVNPIYWTLARKILEEQDDLGLDVEFINQVRLILAKWLHYFISVLFCTEVDPRFISFNRLISFNGDMDVISSVKRLEVEFVAENGHEASIMDALAAPIKEGTAIPSLSCIVSHLIRVCELNSSFKDSKARGKFIERMLHPLLKPPQVQADSLELVRCKFFVDDMQEWSERLFSLATATVSNQGANTAAIQDEAQLWDKITTQLLNPATGEYLEEVIVEVFKHIVRDEYKSVITPQLSGVPIAINPPSPPAAAPPAPQPQKLSLSPAAAPLARVKDIPLPPGITIHEKPAISGIWKEVTDPSSRDHIQLDALSKAPTGGSINGLVWCLVHVKNNSPFIDTFLSTYSSFMTPMMLLQKLLDLAFPQESCPSLIEDQAAVQHRSLLILSYWTSNSDASEWNQDMVALLLSTKKKYSGTASDSFDQIVHNVESKLVSASTAVSSESKSNAVLQKLSSLGSLMDVETRILARQLTLLDHKLFCQIRATEFFNKAWESGRDRAPNIVEAFNRFNEISMWVANAIIRQDSREANAQAITKMVHLGLCLYQLKSFASLQAVLRGLSHPSIVRLNSVFEQCPEKTLSDLELLQLWGDDHDEETLQTLVRQYSNVPIVPFIGTITSEVSVLYDTLPDFASRTDQRRIINWQRCEQLHAVLRNVASIQQQSYDDKLTPIQDIQDMIVATLKDYSDVDEGEMYQLSMKIQPY